MNTEHTDYDAFSSGGHGRVYHTEIPVEVREHGDEELNYLEGGLKFADEFLNAPALKLDARQKSLVRTKLVKLLREEYSDHHTGSLHAFVDTHIPPLIWEVRAAA